MNSSTIAAISTPNAPGGIGIIRISGDDALTVADKVFISVNGMKLTESKGYRAYFGSVVSKGQKIDEAVCLVYRAPHSYTGENTVEINCHGGLFVTRQVLRAVLEAGASPAGPGEFTKRAFLNGKMDLASSESVMSLISASGKQAASAALNTLEGALSKEIKKCCSDITRISATLAAWVDYPDDEIDEIGLDEMKAVFFETKNKLSDIVSRYDCGKAITDGVDTVIIGKPNVGKSTIMNMLSGYERSIVTDIAGTTRDVVEERVMVGDIILRISDTAGIHDTNDRVENIGVDMAKKRMSRADLVLAVFDNSNSLSSDDLELINACKEKKRIALLNKSDLPSVADKETIEKHFDSVIEISAKTGLGRELFEKELQTVLMTGEFDPDAANITGERQRSCCLKAIEHLEECLSGLNSGLTLDAINVCADCAVDALLELTGEKASETIVNEIFSRFCVGK